MGHWLRRIDRITHRKMALNLVVRSQIMDQRWLPFKRYVHDEYSMEKTREKFSFLHVVNIVQFVCFHVTWLVAEAENRAYRELIGRPVKISKIWWTVSKIKLYSMRINVQQDITWYQNEEFIKLLRNNHDAYYLIVKRGFCGKSLVKLLRLNGLSAWL